MLRRHTQVATKAARASMTKAGKALTGGPPILTRIATAPSISAAIAIAAGRTINGTQMPTTSVAARSS